MKALYFDNNLTNIGLYQAVSKIYKNAGNSFFSPVKYGEIPEPQLPGVNWLKIKNKSCGLCGTDLHFMYFDMSTGAFPAAIPGVVRKFLGHELLGTVMETGAGVKGVKQGDRVTMRIDWPSCSQLEIEPPCGQCASGNYMLCENSGKKELPLQDTGGGFSPCMVMHKSQFYKIPDSMSDDEANLLEPLACAVHGVYKNIPAKHEKVLVVGCGTIGLLSVAVAKAVEPQAVVYALVRYEHQAELARKMGADEILYSGSKLYEEAALKTGAAYNKGYFGNEILLGGFDIIYDCIGNDSTVTDSLRLVKGGGAVVLLGINFMPGSIDYTPIWNQEIRLTGINAHANESARENSFDVAAKLMKEKKIDTSGLITHRYPMAEYREAVKTFVSKGKEKAVKIILDHQEG